MIVPFIILILKMFNIRIIDDDFCETRFHIYFLIHIRINIPLLIQVQVYIILILLLFSNFLLTILLTNINLIPFLKFFYLNSSNIMFKLDSRSVSEFSKFSRWITRADTTVFQPGL